MITATLYKENHLGSDYTLGDLVHCRHGRKHGTM